MKKSAIKNKKPRNRNKSSMLSSTDRKKFGVGSKVVETGLILKNVISDALTKSNEQLAKTLPRDIGAIYKESENLAAEGLKGKKLHETTLENVYGSDWKNTSPYTDKHVGDIRKIEAQRRGGGKTISDDASLAAKAADEIRQMYRAVTTEGTVGQNIRSEGFGEGLPVDRESRKKAFKMLGLGIAGTVGTYETKEMADKVIANLKASGIDPEEATPEQISKAETQAMTAIAGVSDKVAQDRAEQDRLFSEAFSAGAAEFVHNGKIYAVQFKEQDITPKKDSKGRIFRYIPELERALPVDPETNEVIFETSDPMPKDEKNEGGLIGNQSKIAKQAGDPNKIEKEDFAALRNQNQARQTAQEGGAMKMPPELTTETPTEETVAEDQPVDTYPNATLEEIKAADQRPDAEMEDNYMEFVLSESLNEEEQDYLMNTLEGDPQLSMIFDKVVETASEFSGSGEVTGPGNGLSDSIPARLSDGEFVMTKKATDQIGADNLQRMMDDAERAFDGGMMRENRQLGGLMANDRGETELRQADSTDDEIQKLMSLKANKAPSLS